MITESRDERLKQIREARKAKVLPWSHLSSPPQQFRMAGETLDFLLSLLDSQAAGIRQAGETLTEARAEMENKIPPIIEAGIVSVATRMRDACVAKVRALREIAQPTDYEATIWNRIVTALEQVEKKQ